MRFSDLARTKLTEAKDQFGAYAYNDKGPSEVMDVPELVIDLKKLPVPEMITELKHLALRGDCPLDPTSLVSEILGSIDSDPTYDEIFQDDELSEYY